MLRFFRGSTTTQLCGDCFINHEGSGSRNLKQPESSMESIRQGLVFSWLRWELTTSVTTASTTFVVFMCLWQISSRLNRKRRAKGIPFNAGQSKGIPREKWLNTSGLGIVRKRLPRNVPLASKRKCMTLAVWWRRGRGWILVEISCWFAFFPQTVDAVIVFS